MPSPYVVFIFDSIPNFHLNSCFFRKLPCKMLFSNIEAGNGQFSGAQLQKLRSEHF